MKDCGALFPGVEYIPMKPDNLRAFVYDIKNFGFTPCRKTRILQAVGRLCSSLAVLYVKKYGKKVEIGEFSAPAWFAIENAVDHYDFEPGGCSFATLLIFWLRHEFDQVIFRNVIPARYNGDKNAIKFISADNPINNDPDGLKIIDTLGDETTAQELERVKIKRTLDEIFINADLDEKSKDIVLKYFGLNDFAGIDLETIAKNMGVSKERVRQIKNRALKILKMAAKTGNEKQANTNEKGIKHHEGNPI